MSRRKKAQPKLKTLIIYGECPCDKVFLEHMKQIYDGRESGQRVNIDSADGGSPEHIIETVVRNSRHTEYDRCYILLDSDIPITQEDRKKAGKNKIELVESAPHCLEGMLLDVLGQPIPANSKACKKVLCPKLDGKPTERKAYSALFSRQVLDNTEKEQIVILRNIIGNTNPSEQ